MINLRQKIMKPKSTLTLLLLCIILITNSVFSVKNNSMKKLAREISQKIKNRKIKRIAILKFQGDVDIKKSELRLLQDQLISHMVDLDQVEMIERTQLKSVLTEKELSQTGLLEDSFHTDYSLKIKKKITKVLGIQAVVVTSVLRIKKKLVISSRAISTNTAKILAAAQAEVANLLQTNPTSSNPELNRSGPLYGKPLVQLAILLDTSNSMDGLIKQTKTRLWRIVNELATAERKGDNPEIEVALYEYGNDRIAKQEGYLRQVIPFTSDLDKISEKLFALKTHGGQEYAGLTISDSVSNLTWKPHRDVYKAIFIAGNEPFTQGPMPYQKAIAKAAKKGILVNTIFCGSFQVGASTGWKAAAKFGHGQYLNINPNHKVVHIKTPQDDGIEKMGQSINKTYIPYGNSGRKAIARQKKEDDNAMDNKSSGASVQRFLFKSKKQYYRSSSWDLVTLIMTKKLKMKDIKKKFLPKYLQKKSLAQLKKIIQKKIDERNKIVASMNKLRKNREKYLVRKRKELAGKNKNSLDEKMMNSIKDQAEELDFEFK